MNMPNVLLCAVSAVAGMFTASAAIGAEPAVEAVRFRFEAAGDSSLGLWEGDKPVLVYNYGPIAPSDVPNARARACYFHPVYGLDGEVLTDDFPKDHVYHRGMYWAWPHIKIGDQEYDLWSDRGELRQVFRRWLAKEAGAAGARLAVENGWFVGDKQLVREQVQIDVHPVTNNHRAVDLTLSWTPIDQPLTLRGAEGKSYGGFNFRFGPRTKTVVTVPEKTVLPDGVTAAAGRLSGDLVVTQLPWADFVGDFERAAGISGAAVFVAPLHPDYPPTWMVRHYGLVSVGWPGVEPRTIPVGESINCRYRIWIHRGAPSAAEIQKEYDAFCNSAMNTRR
jgi:methane monooxygenase PmoA-like